MRNRAKPSPSETSTANPAPAEFELKKRTKYDELVEVLVDGLFEIMMTESPHAPDRTKARRGRERR